jgi:hypothetical protein
MDRLNVTLIDVVYILSGLIGLLVSLHALPSYHHSTAAAGRVRDPSDRRDAVRINRGMLTREYVRLTIHILGVTVGVAALWIVPVPRPVAPAFDRAFGFALDAILLWANIGTTVNTILAWMEYCVVRQRGWFEEDGMLSDLRTRLRRAEPKTKGKHGIFLSRDKLAAMIREVRSIRRRQKAIDLRGTATDVIVGDHEDRIEVVEEVVYTERKTTRRSDGSEDGSANHADRG